MRAHKQTTHARARTHTHTHTHTHRGAQKEYDGDERGGEWGGGGNKRKETGFKSLVVPLFAELSF